MGDVPLAAGFRRAIFRETRLLLLRPGRALSCHGTSAQSLPMLFQQFAVRSFLAYAVRSLESSQAFRHYRCVFLVCQGPEGTNRLQSS